MDPRDDFAGVPGTPRLGIEPVEPGLPAVELSACANPLWAIPVESLRATRDRPIFLPSRRPLAPPAVAAAPRAEPARPAAAPLEPEQRSLNLLGVVAGAAGGFAVFTNLTTRDIVRLRTGESHDGWILRAVRTLRL